MRPGHQLAEAELGEGGEGQVRRLFEDVPKRVRAFVAVVSGVRGMANPDAIQDNHERAHAQSPIGCQAVFISTVSRIQ